MVKVKRKRDTRIEYYIKGFMNHRFKYTAEFPKNKIKSRSIA